MIPEEILMTAKKAVLLSGQFQPTLFVHGTKAKVYMPLPFGKSNEERVSIMTEAGIQLAQDDRIGDVELVYYVSEAWASPARTPFTQPSEDPNRMEVLLFNVLDARTRKQVLEMHALVRDGKRNVVDLKAVPLGDGKGEVGGRLLPSFMAGFTLFKR